MRFESWVAWRENRISHPRALRSSFFTLTRLQRDAWGGFRRNRNSSHVTSHNGKVAKGERHDSIHRMQRSVVSKFQMQRNALGRDAFRSSSSASKSDCVHLAHVHEMRDDRVCIDARLNLNASHVVRTLDTKEIQEVLPEWELWIRKVQIISRRSSHHRHKIAMTRFFSLYCFYSMFAM